MSEFLGQGETLPRDTTWRAVEKRKRISISGFHTCTCKHLQLAHINKKYEQKVHYNLQEFIICRMETYVITNYPCVSTLTMPASTVCRCHDGCPLACAPKSAANCNASDLCIVTGMFLNEYPHCLYFFRYRNLIIIFSGMWTDLPNLKKNFSCFPQYDISHTNLVERRNF